ncbi:hypothetical protein MYP_636 [Sporocytophaga myxococcoides]|uniref:Uncharacterized protein n=1 Tax=Sporocytophaga myxococcoides TaxID=153721 RepID=A0A098LAF4_9BACT|nr:hypothetical protein [Sporocytophaga myxococcoides]GAL83409.1 hypothetical protein MYP_636 [Sporocytophaga myxococcoides]
MNVQEFFRENKLLIGLAGFLLPFLAGAIITANSFYFTTNNSLSVHETRLARIEESLAKKPDEQALTELREQLRDVKSDLYEVRSNSVKILEIIASKK